MNKPLSEHPNPQFYRESYLSLNGEWDYAISKSEEFPKEYQGKILVPYSPEASLSGVKKVLQPDEWLFYRLKFNLNDFEVLDKVILHFLAVDQIAEVYFNDEYLGKHIGGYLPFSFEIQDYLKDENELIVKVKDFSDTSFYSRGKQKLNHSGIWYTPNSGIYMPVYIESVNDGYIKDIKITPDIDKEEVIINVSTSSKYAEVHIFGGDRPITPNEDNHIKVKDMHLWSPEDPYLYIFKVSTDTDEVTSYFAMRKFSVVKDDKGIPRLGLNNKPYFMKGVLDQGYFPGGLLTPRSYEDYKNDVKLIKDLGFNTVRKHIKIEAPRFYYECDRQGLIVWQDFINGGEKYKFSTIAFPLITGVHHNDHNYKKFARNNKEGREFAIEEMKGIIHYLYNVPSIGLWTIFNEGWGQFDAKEVYEKMHEIDSTRIYDHASGWHDQKVSDTKSLHVYFKRVKLPKIQQRAIILSEFGGFYYKIEGHMIKGKQVYKGYNSAEDWLKAYETSINEDVIKNVPFGLSASIYTQLSDVEEELNGFVTMDREVIKVDPKKIKEINDKIKL